MANKRVRKIGRDTKTGKFISVKEAEKRKENAVIETIKYNPVKK
jgi:hypothetical protein